jgi:hypothetical protein
MFGGLIFAIATIAVIELGQRDPWWFAAFLPLAAGLGYVIRIGFAYGSVGAAPPRPRRH